MYAQELKIFPTVSEPVNSFLKPTDLCSAPPLSPQFIGAILKQFKTFSVWMTIILIPSFPSNSEPLFNRLLRKSCLGHFALAKAATAMEFVQNAKTIVFFLYSFSIQIQYPI